MKACPYRKDFYAKLGSPADRVNAQLNEWLSSLERIVQELQQFYEYVLCTCSLLTVAQTGQLCKGPVNVLVSFAVHLAAYDRPFSTWNT